MVVVPAAATLAGGCSAKLTPADDQCVFKHAAGLEVGHQGCDRPVDLTGKVAMGIGDVGMVVPWLACPMPELHIPHATFKQPAGHQRLPPVHMVAVGVAEPLGFFREVKGIGRRRLHPEGQFERFDACFKAGVGTHCRMLCVE